MRAICWELGSMLDPKSSQAPLGSPRGPKWPHGVPREPKGRQSDAKDSPLGAQGFQKKAQSRAKESKMSSKDTQRKPTNQKTIHTQTKYTQTPDPPPYSGRLVHSVYIYIYILIYICIYLLNRFANCYVVLVPRQPLHTGRIVPRQPLHTSRFVP